MDYGSDNNKSSVLGQDSGPSQSSKSTSIKKLNFLGLFKKISSKSLLRESKFYLVEFLIMLVIVFGLVISISLMVSALLSQLINPIDYYKNSGGDFSVAIGVISTIFVLVPVFVVLSRRIAGSESSDPMNRNLSWRNGFLGFFIVVFTLTAIGYGISLIYQTVTYLMNLGLKNTDTTAYLKSLAHESFSVVIYGGTSLFLSKAYKTAAVNYQKIFRNLLVGLSIITVGLYMIFPFKHQRNSYIDRGISDDISSLSFAINEYYYAKNVLPESFDSLTLDKKLKARIQLFQYSYLQKGLDYELCATFKTSTRDSETSSGKPEIGSDLYGYTDDNPYVHSKGKNCFNYVINKGFDYDFPYRYDQSDNSSDQLDLKSNILTD